MSLYSASLSVGRSFISTYVFNQTDGATIKSVSENIVVNPGEEAKLSCAVDGKFVEKHSHFFLLFALLSPPM